MTGELKINNKDAYTQWGAWLDSTGLSTLMTPAPLKEYITNKSPLTAGKKVKPTTPMVDERDLTLTVFIKAASLPEFLQQYRAFVTELQQGDIVLQTKYEAGVTYRLKYISCQQFSNYNGRLGKFILKLNEPDPTNRTTAAEEEPAANTPSGTQEGQQE